MLYPRRQALAAVVLLVSALALAACAPAPPERDLPAANDDTPRAPAKPPEFFPDGSATQNLPYFSETLRKFAGGAEPVLGEQVVNAVAAAGFDKSAMQVSFDRSQTNLVADNIFVSVRIAEDCLIGQVITSNRSFVAAIEPAVGPNGDVCLIGKTRPIDW